MQRNVKIGNVNLTIRIPSKEVVLTDLAELQDEIEEYLANQALKDHENATQAAAALGVKRSAFYYIRLKHGFPIQEQKNLAKRKYLKSI